MGSRLMMQLVHSSLQQRIQMNVPRISHSLFSLSPSLVVVVLVCINKLCHFQSENPQAIICNFRPYCKQKRRPSVVSQFSAKISNIHLLSCFIFVCAFYNLSSFFVLSIASHLINSLSGFNMITSIDLLLLEQKKKKNEPSNQKV